METHCDDSPCGEKALEGSWVSYDDHALAIAQMQKTIDEADRRAGAAERRLEHLRESASRRERWISDAKRQRGYEDGVSFDRVWNATCELADRGLTVSGEAAGWKLVPLELTYEMKAAALVARSSVGTIAAEWEAMLSVVTAPDARIEEAPAGTARSGGRRCVSEGRGTS